MLHYLTCIYPVMYTEKKNAKYFHFYRKNRHFDMGIFWVMHVLLLLVYLGMQYKENDVHIINISNVNSI